MCFTVFTFGDSSPSCSITLRFVVDEKEMLTVVVFVVVVDVSSLVSELAFGNVSVVKILSADIGLSDIPTDETDLTGEFAGTPTTALALRPQTIFGASIKDKRITWIPGFILVADDDRMLGQCIG